MPAPAATCSTPERPRRTPAERGDERRRRPFRSVVRRPGGPSDRVLTSTTTDFTETDRGDSALPIVAAAGLNPAVGRPGKRDRGRRLRPGGPEAISQGRKPLEFTAPRNGRALEGRKFSVALPGLHH